MVWSVCVGNLWNRRGKCSSSLQALGRGWGRGVVQSDWSLVVSGQERTIKINRPDI